MDPYIPSAHPFYSKNSGEMLKVRPGPHVPLELTRSTFEAPITVARNTVRAPVRAENLPVLPLYSELERGAGTSSAPVPTPRKVPEPPIVRTSEPVVLQTQERHVPVFKSIGGEDDESSTFDIPKSSLFPVPIPDPNAVPAPGYKSEGGDHIEEFVPKFGFKSEGGGIYPLIPLKPSSPFVEKLGFKSEGGDPEAPSLGAIPTGEVLAPVLNETSEQLKSRETLAPSAISIAPLPRVLAPVLNETSEQLESRVTLASPGIPLVPSPLESLTTAEPIEILAPVLVETLEQLKSREIPAIESMTAPTEHEVSLSDFYKELIEEARSAPEEVAPVDVPVAQLDTIDTQWSNLSTKPEDEIQPSEPIGRSQQPEVADQEQQKLPENDPEHLEPKAPATVEFIYPTTQNTIQVEPVASLGQKPDYLQFEKSLPQIASVPKESQETSQAREVPEAPEAPKEFQIKNMDLLYDQVSYYQNQQEPAEFEVPESVIVESVRSMILEPEVSAPREDSIRNGFEEFTHETVAQENGNGYQLSENERQLIEENKKFFKSGQDHVESPREINPIMMWSQQMTESYSTPDSPPVVESAGSPEPPVGNNGNERIPTTDLDSLVGEYEQFDNDELYEAEKHEKDVPQTM